MREEIDLSGIWRYQPDVYDEGERLGYAAGECDVRFWREARVPGLDRGRLHQLGGDLPWAPQLRQDDPQEP